MRITVSERTKRYARMRAKDHMSAMVSVYRPEDPQIQFNDATGISEVPAHQKVYEGVARVWNIDTSGTLILGEADVAVASTNVSIPYDGSIEVRNGDVVYVLAHDSVAYQGKAYTVQSVTYGGYMDATIRMSCTGLTASNSWEPYD